MPTTDYLVEMKTTPATGVPSAADVIAITERFVLPTLEACDRLTAEGRIVGGGLALAGTTCSFVVRADSPEQVEKIVTALPLWPRTQTTVVPLTAFRDRADAVRQRLSRLREATPSRN